MNNLREIPIDKVDELRLMGRSEMACPLALFWNHNGIEMNITGSELWVKLEADYTELEPWIAYDINGSLVGRMMVTKGEHSICLFRGMDPALVKNVRLYRESQPFFDDKNNCLKVWSILCDGEVKPLEEPGLRIEFIGDSITSGEGTYGGARDQEWKPMYMSSSRNYVRLLEKGLNADIHVLSQGGWGVYSGYDRNLCHTLSSIYGIGYDPDWKPDYIVINLGTNDGNAALPVDDFKKAGVEFLGKIRGMNPWAHIIWAYGNAGYEMEAPIKEMIDEYVSSSGDENVTYISLPGTTEETVGSRCHPGFALHIESAQMLGDYIAAREGMEYTLKGGNII